MFLSRSTTHTHTVTHIGDLNAWSISLPLKCGNVIKKNKLPRNKEYKK